MVFMPYEKLIDALLEEGKTKSEAIVRTAHVEAERQLNDARQQCEILDCQAEADIRRHLSAQRTAILSSASLSARHVLLTTKREILDAVWRRVAQEAMALPGNARTTVLHALLAEVLTVTSFQSPRVFIESRERPYLEDILKERGIAFIDQHEDGLLLGVRVEANGEIFTNGFAARLAKAKPELMIELNRLLFADRDQQSVLGKSSKLTAES